MAVRPPRRRAPLALLGLLVAGLVGTGGGGPVGVGLTGVRALGSSPGPGASEVVVGDGQIDLRGLYHDSRSSLYRTPGGAVPAGTPVTIRLRTLHDDVTSAELYLTDPSGMRTVTMTRAASDVACGAPEPAPGAMCDLWSARLAPDAPVTWWYRFGVQDGEATAGYGDDAGVEGGPGIGTAYDADRGWVLTAFAPGFTAPSWLKDAVVYQVFPDRFVNGDPSNDANTDEPRYGYPPDPEAQVRRRAWGELPETSPRGRDYYGGDLAGIRSKLGYLHGLGVTVLYLNPIFAAASNHSYDTRDYRTIDPRFGTEADWRALVADAARLGIRIILDGVFNHVSSDSPYFDRYGHFREIGACESVDSPYRTWFIFRDAPGGGPCAGPKGPRTMDYLSWQGYDSLPVLQKRDPSVRRLIYDAPDAVARTWLRDGASGWRLDVMPDGTFPADFWPAFRAAVKAEKPDAAIVGELWKRADVLPFIRGDSADTTMNYRFRDAVLGFLAGERGAASAAGGGSVAGGGSAADGGPVAPSTFAGRILSILEDYPRPAAYRALNLLDSHDTERALWSLTPGAAGRANKEAPANLEVGKARLRLASLVQFTMPGAPTIYYGDEAGVTGAGDPDDRRTFPLDGGDRDLVRWYAQLGRIRGTTPVLRDGDLRFLLADDAAGTVAWARVTPDGLAIAALNPDPSRAATLTIPLGAPADGGPPIRDGIAFIDALGGSKVTSAGGVLRVRLAPMGGVLLVADPDQDLAGPASPSGLQAVVESGRIRLDWAAAPDARAYEVRRSAVSGGGFETVGVVESGSFVDPGPLVAGHSYHYVVRARDAAGNVGPASGEVEVFLGAGGASAAGGALAGEGVAPAPSIVVLGLALAVALLVVLTGVGVFLARWRARGSRG